MLRERFWLFCRRQVRSAVLSVVIGAVFSMIFSIGKSHGWELVYTAAHGFLFVVAGFTGWVGGLLLAHLIFGNTVNLRNMTTSRALPLMLITGGLVATVGLAFRAFELVHDRLAESIEQLKETEWARKEIEMARSIQTRLLPPQRIEGAGFSIAARNFPAHLVAGDLYDVVHAGELERREFVALAYARFFPADGTLQLANAGFPGTYLVRSNSVEPLTVTGNRLPLGIRGAMRYETLTTKLRPRDRILFVSDGIPAASITEGQPLGYERLAEAVRIGVNAGADAWLEELLARIRSEVREPLEDDWTALVLQSTAEARAAA